MLNSFEEISNDLGERTGNSSGCAGNSGERAGNSVERTGNSSGCAGNSSGCAGNSSECAGRYGAIILAAGLSSRMKRFKPLLPVGEKTAIDRLIDVALASGIREITVVTGHNRHLIEPYIEAAAVRAEAASAKVNEAYNDNFMDGMFSSIKTGIRFFMENTGLWESRRNSDTRRQEVLADNPDSKMKGLFILPVDCPLISDTVVLKLIEAIENKNQNENECLSENKNLIENESLNEDELPNFYVPIFEGKKGHPLYVPIEYAGEICSYEGGGGLKAITDKYWNKMRRIKVKEEGCILDMDTEDGYKEILDFLSSGCKRLPLVEYADSRRVFLIRHGKTKQHKEKMFIGRYDVPLDEESKGELELMAKQLVDEISKHAGLRFAYGDCERATVGDGATSTKKYIYTSPLKRAVETAEIIKAVMEDSCPGLDVEIITVEDLQEISLGSWDGMPIREVKEKFPDEYERRGKDLFAFKIGNKSENYYDVQYRAIRALRKIFMENSDEDIVVISHNAVIRALANNLRGLKVDDQWEPLEKGAYLSIKNL